MLCYSLQSLQPVVCPQYGQSLLFQQGGNGTDNIPVVVRHQDGALCVIHHLLRRQVLRHSFRLPVFIITRIP